MALCTRMGLFGEWNSLFLLHGRTARLRYFLRNSDAAIVSVVPFCRSKFALQDNSRNFDRFKCTPAYRSPMLPSQPISGSCTEANDCAYPSTCPRGGGHPAIFFFCCMPMP